MANHANQARRDLAPHHRLFVDVPFKAEVYDLEALDKVIRASRVENIKY